MALACLYYCHPVSIALWGVLDGGIWGGWLTSLLRPGIGIAAGSSQRAAGTWGGWAPSTCGGSPPWSHLPCHLLHLNAQLNSAHRRVAQGTKSYSSNLYTNLHLHLGGFHLNINCCSSPLYSIHLCCAVLPRAPIPLQTYKSWHNIFQISMNMVLIFSLKIW